MAIGWLILYSKYRKARRRADKLEEELASDDEVCVECGYPYFKHSDDGELSCPSYD